MKRSTLYKYLELSLIIISICIIALSTDNYSIANAHFYLFLGIAILDILSHKSFSLLTVWIAGVIFVILSDIIIYSYGPIYTWVDKFTLLANDAVLAGYIMTKPLYKDYKKTQEEQHFVRSTNLFIIVLVIVYSVYLYNLVPKAIQSFMIGGRNIEIEENNILLSTFLGGYHVLPLIIAFYCIRIKHQSKWTAFILSLPIFFIEFCDGTRFRMLFTILPFLLVSGIIQLDKMDIKKTITLILVFVAIIYGSNYMLHTRRTGFGNYIELERDDFVFNHPHSDNLSVKVCKKCSPEGTINMMNVLHNHLEKNEPTYGLSTGFVLYFWVPRSLWPNKPTMLNHWLPRKYMNVGEGHSTSTGFMGEPYADFGRLAFIFYYIMGILLRRGNNLLIKYDYGRANVYGSLYAGVLIPYVFFAVRSPVTGTCYTLMQWLMLYLFSKFLVKKNNQL